MEQNTNKRLVIIGASGHGKVIADIAMKLNRYEEICFLDDNVTIKECSGFPVIGTSRDFLTYRDDSEFIIGIGNAKIRNRITDMLEHESASITTLVHPNSSIGQNVIIGQGTVVMAGAVINSDSKIGKSCIINTCASVDHDCVLEDYVHVAVGAHVCGTVQVGHHTWIGAGVTVINNLSVCPESMIGAGAVVIKDIIESGTYLGVPVRKNK